MYTLQRPVNALPVELEQLAEEAKEHAANALSGATKRAYRADWADFVSWCGQYGASPLPAEPSAVALFLTDRARTLKTSTLARRKAAISQAHGAKGLESPVRHCIVRTTWRGIVRKLGTAPEKKAALLAVDIARMVDALPDALRDKRDRALILVGYGAALRRSELAALEMSDIEQTDDGLTINIRRSKTDQEGAGALIGVHRGQNPATCPYLALNAWLKASGITAGPLFRGIRSDNTLLAGALSAQTVALVVKRAAKRAGIDPAKVSGHSLRSGFATQTARNGARERDIARTTRHKSMPTLRGYIEAGGLFRDNASALAGL